MLKINGKTFMNLQEAVQWLLDNNALPFQSSANYVANTEIGMGTIVNPSPAKVRIGSLIFFADSKVSTVIGLTENGFICSDQYNNLVDDVVYVSNVALNASGHLIVTLSNGDTIDAGLIKQVTGFSINASQHLIVSYNDSSTTDLGAIFSGNVNIAGNFTADSIIENMTGYSFTKGADKEGLTVDLTYAGAVKNGNKITFVIAGEITRTDTVAGNLYPFGKFNIPYTIGIKLIPAFSIWLAFINTYLANDADNGTSLPALLYKESGLHTNIALNLYKVNNLTLNTKYYFRIEQTFLLSDNLAS